MNNRARGARGEREARDAMNQHFGFDSKRAAQANGSLSADLMGTGHLHVEVKKRKALSVQKFIDQAVKDAPPDKTPIVLMREDRGEWLVMVRIEDAMSFAREILGPKV